MPENRSDLALPKMKTASLFVIKSADGAVTQIKLSEAELHALKAAIELWSDHGDRRQTPRADIDPARAGIPTTNHEIFACRATGVLRFCVVTVLERFFCLASSLFLIAYRFPTPPAKGPLEAWPLHCERRFKPIRVSGSAGAAR
jgi:hypothetical protein